jgi:TatD DNase family protein
MYLIDSHCHLNHDPLQLQLEKLLFDCQLVGIQHFILPATNAQEFDAILAMAQRYPDFIRPALGFHPFWADKVQESDWSQLVRLLESHPNTLLGEIGLDFYQYKDAEHRESQKTVLIKQLMLAHEYQRPITLHLRKANAIFWQLVKPYQVKGFLHAFSGSPEEANIAIKQGWLLGIGTVILNPNARKIRETVAQIDLRHLVLETDAPYMRPQLAQEEYNHPKNMLMVAQEIAKIKQCSIEKVAEQTTKNCQDMLAMCN